MKNFIQQYKEDMAEVEFCPYCLEAKGEKHSCCQENHFIPFADFDDDTQLEMIAAEYDYEFGTKA